MASQLLLFPSRAPTSDTPRGVAPHSPTPAAVIDLHKASRLRRYQFDTAPAGQAGRMVISGRMADVCAALDQLIAAG